MSAPKLLIAAKREALRNGFKLPNLEDAKKASKTETRELFKAPKSLGKVAALKPGFFQFDLPSMQGLASHKGNLDYNWILLGVDIFTGRAYAEKSKTKDGPAIASAMKRLLDSGMKVIEGSSDMGNEFNNPEMRKLLDERNVAWRFRDPEDLNALSTVDRIGGLIKGIQYRMLSANNSSRWIDVLPKAVEGYNSQNNSTVGAPPKEVEENDVLSHLLIKANSRKLETNAEIFSRNSKNMEPGSKFRVLVKEKNVRGLRRGFKPTYSGKVYIAASFPQNARQVKATTGNLSNSQHSGPHSNYGETEGADGRGQGCEEVGFVHSGDSIACE